MPYRYDLVIRNGTLADGTGAPLRVADVAVEGARIAAVGRVGASGREEIDARGLLVTPGFVDIHTHYDGQATWDDRLAPSSWHGVTTAVMGNCGVGFAPVRPQDHERLIELMEGVEDIPGASLHAGLDWSWESFPDYLDRLDAGRHDIDLCAQLPHGALRVFVMGERAVKLEAAGPDDIAEMRRLTEQALRAGAIGFSTSRTLNHRTVTGDPTPSLRATEAEPGEFAPFANYAHHDLDACGEMMRDPNTVMGLGDGGAHVGVISDASFTTHLLAHWGRDRSRGRFPIETLVRKQTADTAGAVGLSDRGVVAPGMKADLNVIDFAALALEAPVMSFDLPAGGKRLLQRARGYVATIVSGEIVYREGEATQALPGRLVRARGPRVRGPAT